MNWDVINIKHLKEQLQQGDLQTGSTEFVRNILVLVQAGRVLADLGGSLKACGP